MACPVNLGSVANPVYEIDPVTGLPIQGTGGAGSVIVGNVAGGAADSGNPVKVAAVYNSTLPTYVTGNRSELQTDSRGALLVKMGGLVTTGGDGFGNTVVYGDSTTHVTSLPAVGNFVFNGTTWDRARGSTLGNFILNRPDVTGGLTASRIFTGTTGFIKASPGQVYKVTCYNVNAAVRYLHLYNKTSAPTLSTDTPIITIALGGASSKEVDFTAIGAVFSTGIAWAYTTDDVAIPTTAGTSAELHATVMYN